MNNQTTYTFTSKKQTEKEILEDIVYYSEILVIKKWYEDKSYAKRQLKDCLKLLKQTNYP